MLKLTADRMIETTDMQMITARNHIDVSSFDISSICVRYKR